MNGPEHYRQAERYTAELDASMDRGDDLDGLTTTALAAIAHDLLASAAATVDATADAPVVYDTEWYAAMKGGQQ